MRAKDLPYFSLHQPTGLIHSISRDVLELWHNIAIMHFFSLFFLFVLTTKVLRQRYWEENDLKMVLNRPTIFFSLFDPSCCMLCIMWEMHEKWLWLWLLALVTCDRWQVTCDMWHVIYDPWNMTTDVWLNLY